MKINTHNSLLIIHYSTLQLSEEEKMQARKNRFLSNSVVDASSEEKKKRRAERFNITSR